MGRRSCRSVISASIHLLLAPALWATGCGDTTQPGPDPTDTTPPTVLSVEPQSANAIEVIFNEIVDENTAQDRSNYVIYRAPERHIRRSDPARLPPAEGDTLQIRSAALVDDTLAVLLSIDPPMVAGITYRCSVSGINDIHGNTMPVPSTVDFVGVDTPDETAPEIVRRSPAPGDTGVGIAASVGVKFTEPLEWNSVLNAFSWTGPGSVPVPFEIGVGREENNYILGPESPLEYGTLYTIRIAAHTAMDLSGNYLAPTSWSFSTTSDIDSIRPTVVAIFPADSATNVPLDVNLEVTFSEPVGLNSRSLEKAIVVIPSLGDGTMGWTNEDSTLTFDPELPLLADTRYNLVIVEGAWIDRAGNPLTGSYWVTFSTGAAFPAGGFSGLIVGDPDSEAAAVPQGALVLAWYVNPLTWDSEGSPPVGGFAAAGQNGDYAVEHLVDGTYWPLAFLDTDGDADMNFFLGDAFGFYGVAPDMYDSIFAPDSVILSGGDIVAEVDITLMDQSAIWGYISYEGTLYQENSRDYDCYVALYDTAGFDPDTSVPVSITEARNLERADPFVFNELDRSLDDGTYFLGAFMDIDPGDEEGYNPLLDPVGFHESGGSMIPLSVKLGRDFGDIDLVIEDLSLSEISSYISGTRY